MGVTTLLLCVRKQLLSNLPTVTELGSLTPKPVLFQQGHLATGAAPNPAHKLSSRGLLLMLSSCLERKPPPFPWPVPLVNETQFKTQFSFSLLETLISTPILLWSIILIYSTVLTSERLLLITLTILLQPKYLFEEQIHFFSFPGSIP